MIPTHEIAICKQCGKEFMRRKNNGKKRLAVKVVGSHRVTCSRECSREYNAYQSKTWGKEE